MATLIPLLKKRLDTISDAAAQAFEDYPGDSLDVVHVLLCAAVVAMEQAGFKRDQIMQLVSVVVDHDETKETD